MLKKCLHNINTALHSLGDAKGEGLIIDRSLWINKGEEL